MALELKLSEQKFWQISPYLAEYLAVAEGEAVWLYVGVKKCEVIVKIHNHYQSMILNKKWALGLNLTPGKWKVRRTQDGIRLGPIIGIVCTELPCNPPAESDWLRYLTAIDGGLGILLTLEGFDQERGRVYGLTLSEDKLHWVERKMPWPDALYVRTDSVNLTLQAFLHKEFPYRHFITQSQDLKPYLPETIIQQSVSKPENDHQSTDFRVLMQKKDDGLWHITGLGGRSGAVARRIKEIYRLGLQVALILEENFGQLGEIGLDLALDREEHLRILEVNGMPGENYISEFSSANPVKNVYTAPMLYAAYLSGFSDVIYPLA